ncbi:uncharacterized protein LOC118416278 [Branchiostoma floridae]|uniref:Uncharacterized protein LOC118416278 n=1 Tax=Branchiostoma floridae TaxID=7739 RepID=A0A9J7L6J6_BRAFL|nr:uncharacterized protein LOC118416278 [Branchiostoma floridae]
MASHDDADTAPSGTAYLPKDKVVLAEATSGQMQSNKSNQSATPSSCSGVDAMMDPTRCNSSTKDADASAVVPDDSITPHTPDTRHLEPMSSQNPSLMYSPSTVNQNSGDVENAREPSPMYEQNAASADRADTENARDPSPMYPQNASNPSPEPANEDSLQPTAAANQQDDTIGAAERDGNPFIQPYQDTNEEDSASACRPDNDDCGNRVHSEESVPARRLSSTSNGVPSIQPYAVANQEDCESASSSANCDDNIQPYAVRYQEEDDGNNMPTAGGTAARDGQRDGVDSGDVDISPYAVAYADRHDDGEARTYENVLNPHPMHAPNALHPNPMTALSPRSLSSVEGPDWEVVSEGTAYRSSGHHPQHWSACLLQLLDRHHGLSDEHIHCSNLETVTHHKPFADLYGRQSNTTALYFELHTEAEDTTYAPDVDGCCSSGVGFVPKPTMETANDSSGQTEPPGLPGCVGKIVPSEKIVFGGKGQKPGKFIRNTGVAVSADHEIFVNDMYNQRIQVYSMDGTFLRLFKTEMPGANGRVLPIQPCDVAMDGEGNVLVLGQKVFSSSALFVLKYSLGGDLMTMFDVQCGGSYPNIAVDARNNNIFVEASNKILTFQPNGKLLRSFKTIPGTKSRRFGGKQGMEVESVAVDEEGNIVVTESTFSSPWVHVYSPFGHRLVIFGGFGPGKGELKHPQGICTDTCGHILVSDWGNKRVDMFTSRGEFVRTVVNITHSYGLAVGPGGQLVVTSVINSTVTIFPTRMVVL